MVNGFGLQLNHRGAGVSQKAWRIEDYSKAIRCGSAVDRHKLHPSSFRLHPCSLSGRNSMVECQLPKLKVASSSLVARSIFSLSNSEMNFQKFGKL